MNKWLWIALSALMILPLAVNAEVYKWKDKDGVTRYSDTPPPSNVQQLSITGKKPVAAKPLASDAAPSEAIPAPKAAGTDAKKKPASSEGGAIKRQEKAEDDKKKAEQAEADLKQKQQNCTSAKANYNSYKLGGRMSKTNEKGEREYLGDADIAQGLEQAQKDVEQYCE
jgi:hypothetical protein